MGTSAEWPTFRRIVVDAFQNAGHMLNVGQEASSLTGILGLVTAGVGVTVFCGIPRFCGDNAITARPVVTDPATIVETHLAWRRAGISIAMKRFIETSQKVGRQFMAA
jgi:DNA-binding transcriptional LysR family regulator